MSSHQSLTEEYLANLAGGGAGAAGVAATVHDSVADSSYLGRALSRPVFLGQAEYQQLFEDLERLYGAIVALPDRLFGGDLAAFARAVGMTEVQRSALMRGRGDAPTRLSRADLYLDDSGFRLLEINMGSTMGGLDNALLNEGMLGQRYINEFVTKHQLTYVDTLAAVAETLLTECKVPTGTRPMMAAADWPESFVTLEPQLQKSSDLLAPLGIDAYPCHVGQLRYSEGRVWLGERPVDVVYRLFGLDNLLSEEGPALIDPVLAAVERGEVKIFTPLDAELFGSKGALSMLSDEANRHLLSGAELTSVDRILPWTRMVRSGPVTLDGRSVDLEQYVLAHREELILKPTTMYGGQGIVQGWLTGVEEWRERVAAAMGGPYLVQRRIRPVPELFAADEGMEPWTLVWGPFLMSRGPAGMWVRGTRGTDSSVTNMAQGATATCLFHDRA